MNKYYYRARYYDPKTGRFLNKDPLGFESDDQSFYRYVSNSPVNNTDPLGRIAAGKIIDFFVSQVFKRASRQVAEFFSNVDPLGVPDAGKGSDIVPGYPKATCNPALQSCAKQPNPVPKPNPIDPPGICEQR